MFEEIQQKYDKFAQSYEDGTRFLPKAAKIAMFWELYPRGAIVTPPPTKDISGEGLVANCKLYRDSSHMETSIIADTYSHRLSVTPQDVEEGSIDPYTAVQAAAVSSALALAGINASPDEIYRDIINSGMPPKPIYPEQPSCADEVLAVPVISELLDDSNMPVEESIPEPVPEISSSVPDVTPEPESEPEEKASEPVCLYQSAANENATAPVQSETIQPSETEPAPAKEENQPKTKSAKAPTATKRSAKTAKTSETEDDLVAQEGMTYEEALTVSYKYQSRSGVLGELLNDNSSRCLLKWMGDPNGLYRKKNPAISRIAQIIVLHNGI